MEEAAASKKRCRYDSEQPPEEAKRVRAELVLDILEDDADSGYRDPAAEDIATVMRFFEEEIDLPKTPPPASDPRQPDLGYLLEASDDELGLPPAAVAASSGAGGEARVVDAEPEAIDFSQNWWFDDEISGFCGGVMGLGIPQGDGLAYDGGILDYLDVLYGASDSSWRPESLPAS